MLKIPGVKQLTEFTYTIGKTNKNSLMLTIKYIVVNNYNFNITKIKVLEFYPDQRCGTVNLLFDIMDEAMKNSLVGKTEFTYYKERMYIYLNMTLNRKRKEIWCSQFTGHIYN